MSRYRADRAMLDPDLTPSWWSRLFRWLVGWVVLPLGFLLVIFAFGMHWGAHNPDSQWVAMTRWTATTFFSVDPAIFSQALSGESTGAAAETATPAQNN